VSELQKVLAALELDAYGKPNKVGLCADAARLLREMARDYDRIDRHLCHRGVPIDDVDRLDAARAKWRLEP